MKCKKCNKQISDTTQAVLCWTENYPLIKAHNFEIVHEECDDEEKSSCQHLSFIASQDGLDYLEQMKIDNRFENNNDYDKLVKEIKSYLKLNK